MSRRRKTGIIGHISSISSDKQYLVFRDSGGEYYHCSRTDFFYPTDNRDLQIGQLVKFDLESERLVRSARLIG